MTNRIWQNFLNSNIHRGINKVAAQKSSSSGNRVGIVEGKCNTIFLMNAYLMGSRVISHGEFYECLKQN